jgi:hypothetical protein
MLFEYLTEVVAGVLAAAIAMKDQFCILEDVPRIVESRARRLG